jgi:hypothetical protein
LDQHLEIQTTIPPGSSGATTITCWPIEATACSRTLQSHLFGTAFKTTIHKQKHPIAFPTPIKTRRRFGGGTMLVEQCWWNNVEQPKTKCVSFGTDKFSKKSFQTSDVSGYEFAKTQMSRPTKPK